MGKPIMIYTQLNPINWKAWRSLVGNRHFLFRNAYVEMGRGILSTTRSAIFYLLPGKKSTHEQTQANPLHTYTRMKLTDHKDKDKGRQQHHKWVQFSNSVI